MFFKSLIGKLSITEIYAQPTNSDTKVQNISYTHTNKPVNPLVMSSMDKSTIYLIDNKEYPIYCIDFYDIKNDVVFYWGYENEMERNRDYDSLCKVRV